jgi:hypothetical protein
MLSVTRIFGNLRVHFGNDPSTQRGIDRQAMQIVDLLPVIRQVDPWSFDHSEDLPKEKLNIRLAPRPKPLTAPKFAGILSFK